MKNARVVGWRQAGGEIAFKERREKEVRGVRKIEQLTNKHEEGEKNERRGEIAWKQEIGGENKENKNHPIPFLGARG